MELGPAEVVEDPIGELALEAVDGEELQIDRAAVAVVVSDMSDADADGSADAEFFVELAAEGFFRGLARFDFAAGELPLEAHGLIRTALADEHFAAAQDQRGHHVADGPVGVAAGIVFGQSEILCKLYVLFLQHIEASEVIGGIGRIKSVRVQGGSDGVETAQERGRGCVEPFVADAIDTAIADGAEGVPVTLLDDAFEGDARAGAAPSGEDDVGIGSGDDFGRGRGTGQADEFAAGGFH